MQQTLDKLQVFQQSPKRKITIMHIITGLSTGGAEMMLYNLLSRSDHQKFQPIVISLMNKDDLGQRIEQLGIPVYILDLASGKPTINATIKLIQLVKEIKPDLIQGWMYHGNLAAQFASWISKEKIPVFWGIHHSINSLYSEKKLTQLLIRLGAIVSHQTNQVIFVSAQSKSQHESLGYSKIKSQIIPNGFDIDAFKPSMAARLKFREELFLPTDTLLIGSIARYHPMKDHANFLKAAALLLAKVTKVHFVMVGTEVDVNNQDLIYLIKDLGIKSQVHLLGERRDIPQITPALDIMTSASAYGEAFPLVIGEAMSCGVPCVVTDVGDSAWIVGDTGYVVEPKNAEALANAWAELIDLGTEARQVIGQRARDKIEQSFAIEAIVARYESLYTEYLRR